MSLYTDHILDLYKHPLNHGTLRSASVSYRAYNPLCGDDITVDLLIEKGKVNDIRHRGVGCAISQVSASLLTEEVKKKSLKKVMAITPDHVVSMLGIDISPVRLKCALLGLEAIQKGISQFQTTV